jgi:hypothetical protein
MKKNEKAKEIIDIFLNQTINFPYIDTVDGQCIGSGYMTYNSAKKCALIYVNGMIAEHTWKSTTLFEPQKRYWEDVKAEIEKINME